MLSYLKGTIVGTQTLTSNRVILVLEVNQVGYEIQITSRFRATLPQVISTRETTHETTHEPELVQIYTHLNVRDDHLSLFGFATLVERDLFRQLIAVSGIGPQLAMALIDTLALQDLVQAIVSGNTKLLSRTPGVGTKTAERISLELRTKLAEWRHTAGLTTVPDAAPTVGIQEDVEMTLLALGYTTTEITQALQAVGQSTALAKNADTEDWIREAIAWLSR
ncbi:MAG: Holliday junction branch migration protein RuvA [Merismopedia sp. SIO2A8]|nr:Holliday junction branch migration protein RuvA [Merismopedia sp. SIO2A8]